MSTTVEGADPAPWWMVETTMEPEGELRMDGRSWWPRAQALAINEQFLLKSEHAGGGRMLVRREAVIQGSGSMIVWILDDDGDMDSDDPRGDRDSDCYVVSDDASGAVDQMVDWIDLDGDQSPDRMEMRYFRDSRLRTAIFMEDHDGDGAMQPVTDYRRKIGQLTSFLIDGYGNNMYFHQKYDPAREAWVPISECPFAFHDTDDDGASEVVLRFATTPINLNVDEEPDYGNSWAKMLGPWLPEMETMAVANVRYSFDIDNRSTRERPTHYDMGLNLVGRLKYGDIKSTRDTQPLARPPQTTTHVPFNRTRKLGDSFNARATGFSWHEFADDSIAIGDPRVDPAWDRRWEGVFWTWNRIFMDNTGGPNQQFNMRREYDPAPSTRRMVYYSEVDGRLHLKGAREGYTRIGAIGGKNPLGEIRTFDTDDDGYFDRWEYYAAGEGWPWLTAEPRTMTNEDFGDDWDAMAKRYNDALPQWIARWEQLIEALRNINGFTADDPSHLTAVLNRELSPGERRYLLECISHVLYRQWRTEVHRRSLELADTLAKGESFQRGAAKEKSAAGWKAATMLSQCDRLLGAGKIEELAKLIEETWQLLLPR